MNKEQLKNGDFFEVTAGTFKMLRESWEAFKLNWQTFAWVFVTIFGAAFVSATITGILFGKAFLDASGGDIQASDFSSAFTSFVFFGLVYFTLLAFLIPLIITAQLASARGVEGSFGEFFRKSKSKVLGFLGLVLLSALLIGAGLIFFIIPGLVIAFFLSFAPYIYLDRATSVTEAMKASYELVKEYWKVTAGYIIVNVAIAALGAVTAVGQLASFALSIAYFCLGAVIYVKIANGKKLAPEATVTKKTTKSPKSK